MKISAKKTKADSTPYITINKLAEYMTADAIRRRQILSALKSDSDFMKSYYAHVRNAFPTFIKSGCDRAVLKTAISKIKPNPKDSDWDKADKANSTECLTGMMDFEYPDLSEWKEWNGPKMNHIIMGGVKVLLKPEMMFMNTITGKVGCMKIHIAKTEANRLLDENRIYAATLLRFGLMEHGVPEKQIDPAACISIDLFLGEYSVSATSYKRRVGMLIANCEEIAARWASI